MAVITESDADSKKDSKPEICSEIVTDLENLHVSDSISVTTKVKLTRFELLRELTKKYGRIDSSESVTSDRPFLDRQCNRLTDSHENHSLSSSSVKQPQNLSKFASETSSTFVQLSTNRISPANKGLSWGDFEDTDSKRPAKASITRLLNIVPAGASYTCNALPKKLLNVNKKPIVSDDRFKIKDSASTISNIKPHVQMQLSVTNNDPEQDVMDVMHHIDPKVIRVCSEGRKWSNETGVKSVEPQIVRQPKKLVKLPLLFKSEKDTGDEVIINKYTTKMNYRTQVMTFQNIIIHGTMFPKPVHSITEVSFNSTLHCALRAFTQPFSIQSIIWPYLLHNMNACVVGLPKSGKTMGYLPVMCSNLVERKERYAFLPTNTISPLVIILCPGTQIADEIYGLTGKILRNVLDRPTVALAVPPMNKACLYQFQKQCDLLITTPVMLVNLLHARVITANRVCHLVLEKADVLLEKYPKEIESLFALINTMLKHRSYNCSVQLVAVSERWTLPLENLLKRLQDTPLVCIGAHLEAALYGRADIQVKFSESQVKKFTLCELLKTNYGTCRIVVVCDNDQQVHELRETMEYKGIKCIYLTNALGKVEIEETETMWLSRSGGKHLVLVCTDEIYNTILHITNAEILVHYSLPSTWTQFCARFRCFLQNYESPLNTNKQRNWKRCKAYVLLDENCGKQFLKLGQFLTRIGVQLSAKFKEYYEASIKEKEDRNISTKVPLCQKLKLFGNCSNLKCNFRHALSIELDYSKKLPKNGSIKFEILRTRNVTSYVIRILEHTDLNGNKNTYIPYLNLHKDLQEVMSQHKREVYDAKLNMKYVFYLRTDGCFYRCIIKKIMQQECITKTATTVIVKLIDAGISSTVSVVDLYEIPKDFRNIPAQGIEVYLANLVPPDSDEDFSTNSGHKVKALIKSTLQDGNVYCTGNILLQLGNAIWIKNMYFVEHLSTLKTTAIRLNLTEDLLKENIASKTNTQLQGLYKLCDNAGIELPSFTKSKSEKDVSLAQVKPQWAFFDKNEQYSEVYMITIETPWVFYIQLKKYHDLLLELQRSIQEVISNPFYPSVIAVCVGQYYLAKDPGGNDFCRVLVTAINDGIANCFYVDYGDYANIPVADVKYLSNEMIEKLPFQAIECCMYGVKPLFDIWESQAVDIMEQYIFEPGTDIFRTLYVSVARIEPALATRSQKYIVLLIDAFCKKYTVLNKILIDCEEAANVDGEYVELMANMLTC